MSKREVFITIRVSKEEKAEVREMAKGMGGISVSDFVRSRIIRPIMTMPEAVQNLKLYIDSKFNNFTHKITETIKELSFSKPIKRTMIIEDYEPVMPIKQIKHPLSKTIDITGLLADKEAQMDKVLKEMRKLIESGEKVLKTPPLIELERKRAKTDPLAFKEWKMTVKMK
ncbi:hypothetical protein LCGC14_0987840 [marine sediment metagenome]|uniref:Uncharacterized protein n=1 Tax=marine sediment metagenome TaxID=412755 RepID=A0A0F9N6R7_9ZZZZ